MEDRGTYLDVARVKLTQAKDDLESAEILMKAEKYKAANNRAYYAIYHAISAVHALKGNSYKSHKDAIANFNKEYVKNEIFPRSIGRKIAEAEEIRHASDYDDFYVAVKEDAKEQVDTAAEIIELIERYCNEHING